MKEKKKIIMTISLIIVLLFAVIGISYAAFRFVGQGNKVNQITTGTISMNYSEGSNVIRLNNALPTTDATGKARLNEGEYFDFSVTTNITGDTIINWEIAAEDFDDNTFDGSNVKFYLTKLVDGKEQVISENLPDVYHEITTENISTGRPANMMSLLTGSTSEQGSVTTNYRLRLYVDENYNPQGDGGGLIFKTRINVYGKISTDGLVMKKDFLADNVEASDITSIITKNKINIPDAAIKSWDISELGNENVVAYIEDDGSGNNTYTLTLAGKGEIVAPTYSTNLFISFRNVIAIDLSYFDTSNVVSMQNMFNGCSSLTELNVSNFDTTNVTTMRSMFNRCSSLVNLDLSNFNTSKVTDMHAMFYICTSLESVNLSSFNTSNVTSFLTMFAECTSLNNLDLTSFDTSKVTIMKSMFLNCMNLSTIQVSNLWNIDSSISTTDMFTGCGTDHVTVV